MKVVFIHAGGFTKDRRDLGKHTLARCRTAVKVRGKKIFLIVADGPDITGTPICRVIKNWLIEQGVNPLDILVPLEPVADNSAAEVVEAQQHLKVLRYEQLLVVSSWWHILPRLWVIWRKYGKGAKPKFVLAQNIPTLRQYFREILGTLAILQGKTGPRYTQNPLGATQRPRPSQ